MTRSLSILIFSILLLTSAPAYTDIEISKANKNDIEIVLPDIIENSNVDFFLNETANFMQSCIKESCGVELKVVREKDFKAKNGIFLSDTKAADAKDIKVTEGDSSWEYRIKVSAGDIFIKGIDKPGKRNIKNFSFHKLGTAKAAVDFLRKFLDIKFLLPNKSGTYIPEKEKIVIPENLDITYNPQVNFCSSRNKEIFYDLANHFLPAVNFGTHGGHSHPAAIPPEKYGKDHPEYFRMGRNGKRLIWATRPLYCYSNPEVRKLIYQELLDHADEGYKVVQLGQPDGFIGCKCEKCAELYDIPLGKTREEISRGWGEKLWIMHRDMAERFLKDRPGIKLDLMAYAATKHPPMTFNKFPENVIIELTKYSEENFKEWEKVTVPGGFYVYIKNWGKYKPLAFTPKLTPQTIAEQAKLFHKYNVKGVYRCGFGELFGLEGPVYYIYGRILANPEEDFEKLLEEYYTGFDLAADPIRKFFSLLHERQEIKWIDNEDWNDPDLINNVTSPSNKLIRILKQRYPENVMQMLNKYLTEAEKLSSEKEGTKANKTRDKISATRIEFDYLDFTMKAIDKFTEYRNDSSPENYAALQEAINRRAEFIMSLPAPRRSPIPLFGYSRKDDLLYGQRGQFNTPFKWNFAFFEKFNINPGNRSLTITDKTNNAEKPVYNENQIMLSPLLDTQENFVLESPTYANAEISKDRIKFSFICKNAIKKDIENDNFTAIIAPDNSGKQQFRIAYTPKTNKIDISKLVEKSSKRNWAGDLYWSYDINPDIKCTVNELPDEKLSVVSMDIPLDIFALDSDTQLYKWQANFVRRDKKKKETYLWQTPLIYKTRHVYKSSLTGELILPESFRTKAEKFSISDKNLIANGDFEKNLDSNTDSSWKMTYYINGDINEETKKELVDSMSRQVISVEEDGKTNHILHLANSDDSLKLRNDKGWPIISNRVYQIVQIPTSEKNIAARLSFNVSGKRLYDDEGKGWNGLTLYIHTENKDGKGTKISRRIYVKPETSLEIQNISLPPNTVSAKIEFTLFGAGEIFLDNVGLYRLEEKIK